LKKTKNEYKEDSLFHIFFLINQEQSNMSKRKTTTTDSVCSKFWSNYGPNEWVSEYDESFFENKGATFEDFKRWRRIIMTTEKKKSILNEPIRLVVIGNITSYQTIDEAKRRLSIHFPIYDNSKVMEDVFNSGSGVIDDVITKTKYRLPDLQTEEYNEEDDYDDNNYPSLRWKRS
jgi:hypothetical protein